jgi:6-phosphogluconolactonase (cycloisomerase 2 family)
MNFLSRATRAVTKKIATAANASTPLAVTMALSLVAALIPLGSCGSSSSSSSGSTHLAYVAAGQNVFAYRVKESSGEATPVIGSPFVVGLTPVSIVVDPSGHFAYVANQGENTISLLKINSSTGAFDEVLPRTQTGFAPIAMVLDTGGKFLFVANQGSHDVSVFSVGSDGVLSAQGSPSDVQSAPSGITLVENSSGEFLLVPVPNFSAIYVFSVNAGALTQVTALPFVVSGGVSTLATDPNGKFLFVPNPSANTLTVLNIGPTGALSTGPGAFGTATSPRAAVTDPSGAYLYVANFGSTNVSQFKVDSTTGALTAFSTTTVAAGTQPSFAVVGPGGKLLFVGNQGSNSISEFTINADGSLSSKGTNIQPGVSPHSIAFAN